LFPNALTIENPIDPIDPIDLESLYALMNWF